MFWFFFPLPFYVRPKNTLAAAGSCKAWFYLLIMYLGLLEKCCPGSLLDFNSSMNKKYCLILANPKWVIDPYPSNSLCIPYYFMGLVTWFLLFYQHAVTTWQFFFQKAPLSMPAALNCSCYAVLLRGKFQTLQIYH